RLTTTPPRPSALRPSVPPELDQIVTRAMAFEPTDRYASAAALAIALAGLHGSEKPAAAGAAVAGAAVAAAATQARPAPIPYPPSAYAPPPAAPPPVSPPG